MASRLLPLPDFVNTLSQNFFLKNFLLTNDMKRCSVVVCSFNFVFGTHAYTIECGQRLSTIWKDFIFPTEYLETSLPDATNLLASLHPLK